ncbi:MAG: hypothetical protein GIW99_06025 [Candidatus Eremiobacteraeota bacterium]|nr:hypothetical protein [Candidatus Eremiobacteraeota bacterium]
MAVPMLTFRAEERLGEDGVNLSSFIGLRSFGGVRAGMVQVTKCAHDACRCLISNTPGTHEFCAPECETQTESGQDAVCKCGHDDCRLK